MYICNEEKKKKNRVSLCTYDHYTNVNITLNPSYSWTMKNEVKDFNTYWIITEFENQS